MELMGGSADPVGALELRLECRRDDPDRGGTRTDPDFPLMSCPLSTLSWIISSSIFDISSTDLRRKSGWPFCGDNSAMGLTPVVGDTGPDAPARLDVLLLPLLLLR